MEQGQNFHEQLQPGKTLWVLGAPVYNQCQFAHEPHAHSWNFSRYVHVLTDTLTVNLALGDIEVIILPVISLMVPEFQLVLKVCVIL